MTPLDMRKGQFRAQLVVSALPIVWLFVHLPEATVVPEALNLPDHLAMFCPEVEVCPERSAMDWNGAEQSYSGHVACCTACSCDDACAQTNNCCFPPTDQHPDLICLYPTTQSLAEGKALPYKSYRMVDRDASKTISGNTSGTYGLQNTDLIPCGEVSHPPFGNLLPVYSKQLNKIYKNPACAASYGVSDGVIWEAKVVCQTLIHPQGSMAFQMLEYGIVSAGCYIDFIYPGNEADLGLNVCYKNMKHTCDKVSFPIPERLNVTATQVRALCESGFISPRHIGNTYYANVFCAMCNNGNPDMVADTMKVCVPDAKSRNERQGISFLLHRNQFGERGLNSDVIIPEVCDVRQGVLDPSSCRELKCPTGQLRGPNGKCDFMVYKKEDTNNYVMVLNVHINNFKISSNDDFKERIEELLRLWNKVNPWPEQGYVHCELNPTNSSYPQVKNLHIEVMASPGRNMPFQTFLKNVKTHLNKRWKIGANGSYIIMHQSWAKFSRVVTKSELSTLGGYYKSFPNYYTTIDPVDLLTFNITEPLMLYLRVPQTRLITIPSALYLTKLYYCKQIELQSHEFVLYNVETFNELLIAEALYNKFTGRLMLENEFLLVNKLGDEVLARICLSDSGFKKKDQVTSSGAGPVDMSYVLVLSLGWSGVQMFGF